MLPASLHKEFVTSLRPRNFSKIFYQDVKMDSVTKISAQPAPSMANNAIVNVMAVICGLAVLVFACMATSGLDMSVGFF